METLEKKAEKVSLCQVLDILFVPFSGFRSSNRKRFENIAPSDFSAYAYILMHETLKIGLYCAALHHLGVIPHIYS